MKKTANRAGVEAYAIYAARNRGVTLEDGWRDRLWQKVESLPRIPENSFKFGRWVEGVVPAIAKSTQS